MGIPIDYPVTRSFDTFIDSPGVFTPSECAKIIEIAEGYGFEQSRVLDEVNTHDVVGKVNPVRTSFSAWLPSLEHKWVLERLYSVAAHVNQAYQFDIETMDDMLQVIRYEVGQQYKWHCDVGAGVTGKRKISLVAHLVDNDLFDGGELSFFNNKNSVNSHIGSVTAFPSYEVHRAGVVTSGVRYALVAWVNGRPFR